MIIRLAYRSQSERPGASNKMKTRTQRAAVDSNASTSASASVSHINVPSVWVVDGLIRRRD